MGCRRRGRQQQSRNEQANHCHRCYNGRHGGKIASMLVILGTEVKENAGKFHRDPRRNRSREIPP